MDWQPPQGRLHPALPRTNPFSRLCSTPSSSPAKERRRVSVLCGVQEHYWVVGLSLLPRSPKSDRHEKGSGTLQNQWDGRNTSLAGLLCSYLPRSTPLPGGLACKGVLRKGQCREQGGDREAAIPGFVTIPGFV